MTRLFVHCTVKGPGKDEQHLYWVGAASVLGAVDPRHSNNHRGGRRPDPQQSPEQAPFAPEHPNPLRALDPLVIDLNGTGISLTNVRNSTAYFDYGGTGFRARTGWITPTEGVLINDIHPGTSAVTADEMLGANSGDGFADLAQFDSNGDGKTSIECSGLLREYTIPRSIYQAVLDKLDGTTKFGVIGGAHRPGLWFSIEDRTTRQGGVCLTVIGHASGERLIADSVFAGPRSTWSDHPVSLLGLQAIPHFFESSKGFHQANEIAVDIKTRRCRSLSAIVKSYRRSKQDFALFVRERISS